MIRWGLYWIARKYTSHAQTCPILAKIRLKYVKILQFSIKSFKSKQDLYLDQLKTWVCDYEAWEMAVRAGGNGKDGGENGHNLGQNGHNSDQHGQNLCILQFFFCFSISIFCCFIYKFCFFFFLVRMSNQLINQTTPQNLPNRVHPTSINTTPHVHPNLNLKFRLR